MVSMRLLLVGAACALPVVQGALMKPLSIHRFSPPEPVGSGILIGEDAPADPNKVYTEFVELPLDHFGSYKGTYKNRYFLYEEYYKPGGPVIVFDSGETDATGRLDAYFLTNNSFALQMLKEFSGVGIIWEHRYYGASAPINITLDTPLTDFEWHTSKQALADIPAFAPKFKSPAKFTNVDLTPKSVPWVMIGGSYPGMRAAFTRDKYPGTIFASWASSAPVQAQKDMSVYFEQVARGMQAYGFGNCTKDILAALTYVDGELAKGGRSAAKVKQNFLGRNADQLSNADLADALTVLFYFWQSNGIEGAGGEPGLREFCDYMETDPKTGRTAPAGGFSATEGIEDAAEKWMAWPHFAELVNYFTPTTCEGPVHNNTSPPPPCQINARTPYADSIAWTWQYCNEWGYFQSANFGPNRIISKYNSLQHQQDICYRQFPNGLSSGLLAKSPKIAETNAYFGGWNMRPSNVYWSGGEFDPWRTLSPLSTEPFSPNFKLTQEVPVCGVSTDKSTIFGYDIPNAEHHFDFNVNFAPGTVSRNLFIKALHQWLPCWKKPSY